MTTLLDDTRINEADVQALKESMTTKELAVSTPVQNDKLALTPVQLLRIAVEQNADVDKLEKLMGLQERWEANEAKKAFGAALNAFKDNPPLLEKVKKVDFSSKGGNRVHYNYAPLDHVAKVLGAALSKHDLSFRWNVQQTDGRVTVTCILQHSGGHSESVSMSAGVHDDERMNAIQRLGSTVTYLERYTLLAATGTATQEQDDDGGMTMGDLAEKLEFIANCNNEEELRTVFAAAYKEARVAQDATAQKALIAAKDKRKKELQ